MAKTTYTLVYKDFIGRKCSRKYNETCIVPAVDKAKKFMQVNKIKVGKLITPTGKEYYV